MAADPNERVLVAIYCPFCGNRSARNVATGAESEMVMHMTPAQLQKFRADLPTTKCVFCGSEMAVRELEEGPGE
jgi:hypothetical protein